MTTPSSPTTMTGRELGDAVEWLATDLQAAQGFEQPPNTDDFERWRSVVREIAAAVNDYDRLRAIEEAARAYVLVRDHEDIEGAEAVLAYAGDEWRSFEALRAAVKLREEG